MESSLSSSYTHTRKRAFGKTDSFSTVDELRTSKRPKSDADSSTSPSSLFDLSPEIFHHIIQYINQTTHKVLKPCEPPFICHQTSNPPAASVYYVVHPLKSLSLTCKYIRPICLEHLFTSICLSSRHGSLHSGINTSSLSLMKFIGNSLNIAQTIRSFTLDGDIINRSASKLFLYVPCLRSLRLLRSVCFLRDAFPLSDPSISTGASFLQHLQELTLMEMHVDVAVQKLFECVSESLEILIIKERIFDGAKPFQFQLLSCKFERLSTFRYHGSGTLAIRTQQYPLEVSEFIYRLPNLTTLGVSFLEDESVIQQDGSYVFFDSPIGAFSPEKSFRFNGNELQQVLDGVRFVQPGVYTTCWTKLLCYPGLFTPKLATFAVMEDFSMIEKVLCGVKFQSQLQLQNRTCLSESVTTLQYIYDTSSKPKYGIMVPLFCSKLTSSQRVSK